MSDRIVFEDVSKFYGEILGVNRVNLSIPPGITSLVGPNGSGKTTLMNLMTGLVKPTRGRIEILGYRTDDSENLSFMYGKGDVVDRNQTSVLLDEVLNRNRCRRAGAPLGRRAGRDPGPDLGAELPGRRRCRRADRRPGERCAPLRALQPP